MLTLTGYQIIEQIYESANSVVYRGIRQQDSQTVMLKFLKEEYPSPQALIRYKQEYEIARNLNISQAVKAYSLESYQKTLAIVLEDFGGLSLKQVMGGTQLTLPEFFNIAIQTAESLGHIHAANIIHKDINPANIVFNPQTNQVKIIDFGISTQLTRENPTLKNPNILEGTLAYLSPEQTGRMNRALDYRTDFYSLGITFYELLTGKLPFESNDPLELVHCHIAKQPIPPDKINTEIPKAVSHLVMKLIAKTAEERYQSAWGIKADLEECWQQLVATGTIPEFPLGTQDISGKFQIPQKLYGREVEIATLLAAFNRVSAQGESQIEMILVAGYSGIGKSALVQEIYKPITEKRGYFISGKFDQFQRNLPYSAVVSAFQELVRQLLAESQAQLNQWREKLLNAVGVNGQLIIDVIPEIELIVGKQPAVLELGPTESQNRFNLVFGNFIRAFCSREHPLAIFLDDLQWADSATLKLIELMMADPEMQYLFLIGAYRDNEVNSSHPLAIALDGLQKSGATVNFITLAPLALEPINELITETLQVEPESVVPLAELVWQKTAGNPFFVNEFLKTLHSENLIAFNFEQHNWQWQIAQIQSTNITDNVVELMIGKLKKLPESTQQVLQLAACVGADFDLNTLAIVSERSPSEIATDLAVAVQSGLILTTSELDSQLLIQNYKFLHDRVQQAAYALIDEWQKQVLHLQMGRLLWHNTPTETLSENVFKIVDHVNLGIELIGSPEERLEISQLNLIAGKKAKTAAAYTAALDYLTTGMKFLPNYSWERQYDLTLALYQEAVEVTYLLGNFQQMDAGVTVVLSKATNLLDKLKVYQTKIQACMAQGQLLEGVRIGLQVLKLLGVDLPESPTFEEVRSQLAQTQAAWIDNNIADLINLPPMTDTYKLAAMYMLSSLFSPAYIAAPALLPLIPCEQVNLSIQYGNATFSAFGYANYGVILNGVSQDIEKAYQFGNLALNLVEKLNAKELKAKVINQVAVFILHGKDLVRKTVPMFREAYQIGVENGDLEFAGYAAMNQGHYAYFSGLELNGLQGEMTTYSHALAHLKQDVALNYNQIFRQVVFNLTEKVENRCRLMGDVYNEEKLTPVHLAANDRVALHYLYLHKTILSYLFGEYQLALDNSRQCEQYLDGGTGFITIPEFYFYDSLVRLAALSKLTAEEDLLKVASNQEKIQNLANHAPMNYWHKFYLVAAERYRVQKSYLEAMDYYEQAIAGARENQYLNEEALALELAAKFYLEWGKEMIAKTYMTEAHYAYSRWGATAKVKDLEAKYSQLIVKTTAARGITDTRRTTTNVVTTTGVGEALDLATVMKASQAISGEIVLDKLLSSLMKILIENAGAQVGYLILEKEQKLLIEAAGNVEKSITVLQSIPMEEQLPASIINYVARTLKSIVLNDGSSDEKFIHDPYIKANQTKSILCTPLMDQGHLGGIVYLENNLTTGAFTPDRLEVLKLLSGQAAIAISNAKLYTEVRAAEKLLAEYNRTLEIQVAERTQELSQTLEHLQTTQEELIQSEKMAALGQLIAGIAHEINTPLGAIRSSAGNIAKFLNQTLAQLPELFQSLNAPESEIFFNLLNQSLQKESTLSAKEERQLKRALIRELETADIANADTIADTLVDMKVYEQIDNFLPLLKRSDRLQILDIAYKLSGLQRGTQTIETATDRASKVVFALKTYARYDQLGKMILASLTDGLETVLTLYQNQLKQGVEVIRNYDELPPILCYPDELNQVWTNLIHNALQAMSNRGTLTIEVMRLGEQAQINITDTGIGISPEIQSKIFDPFFTTKPPGEGSGLGLDIVKKIIAKHSGQIAVESEPGRTTFMVLLPMKLEENANHA